MKKDLMKRAASDLARAKQEFARFKEKRSDRSKAQAMAAREQAVGARAADRAHKMLHCSEQTGRLSRLEFKVSPDVASAVKATAVDIASYGDERPVAADLDAFILKSKVNISPDYNGCAHCGKRSFCRCRCGVISCHAGDAETHKCPACGETFPAAVLMDAIELTGSGKPNNKAVTADRPPAALPRRANKAIGRQERKALPNSSGRLPPGR